MKNYEAISGVTDIDAPLFAEKYSLLADALSPTGRKAQSSDSREGTFDRILKVCSLPTFNFHQPDRSFDMQRFLDVRVSREAADFRVWLRNIQSANDRDIAKQVNGIRSRLGPIVHGTSGKMVRLVVPAVAGFVADLHLPGSGTVLGMSLGTLDLFLLERLFPTEGPHLFLSRTYASLFEPSDHS
jgi:hypothetical protein